MRHQVQWTAPAPLWGRAPDLTETGRIALRRPTLLRFATDSFMEEFHRTLDTDPSKLASLEAEYETWRGPGASTPAVPEATRPASRLEQRLARLRVSADRRLAMFGQSSGVGLAEPPSTTASGAGAGVVSPGKRLKLYQPAHQRFYLVTAALVCRMPGLPDRTINATRQEKTSFVMRRIRTATDSAGTTTRLEYGFIPSATGGVWRAIQAPETSLAPGEDRLPLFAVNFKDDTDKKRRVLAALVPVGRREAYVGAPEQTAVATTAATDQGTGAAAEPGAPPPPVDPRIALLSAEVIEPWKALVQRAAKGKDLLDHPGKDENGNALSAQALSDMRVGPRENTQLTSWYVLLDFITFLEQQLKPVWEAITNDTTPPEQAQRDLVAAIAGTVLPATLEGALTGASPGRTVKHSLKAALAAVGKFREALERATGDFGFTTPTGPNSDYPDFLFPLADAEFGGPEPPLMLPPRPTGAPPLSATSIVLRKISALRDLVAKALPATPTWAVPDLPIAAQPIMAPQETARFVIRCVFERPECGPLDPPLLSAPSREFELAAFFDPDAPARPIRISLPVDTSPAGLRRAPKNTAFVISDVLCGQINRAKGLGLVDLVLSVLPWPFHKDLPNASAGPCTTDTGASLGMICSLSIPIITICALILLIIIVIVLDIIFKWLPWLIVCFPLPGFGAKPAQPSQS